MDATEGEEGGGGIGVSEMVDRVARAMSEISIPVGPDKKERSCWPGWTAMDEVGREPWRRYARAAIEAMREPSDAMLSATEGHDDAPVIVWETMIDAALND